MGRNRNTQKQQKKEKIRRKIQNADTKNVIVIPAKPRDMTGPDAHLKRVAAYCRVSTDEDTQTTSFELQKKEYTRMISNTEGWKLAGIYADEGISGTSINHRLGMQQMIEDCKAGKIDMIITKSISRVARHIVDCVNTIEMLRNLPKPVSVVVETEHLNTGDESGRMILAILSTIAEEESHTKSRIMNWSLDHRFKNGIWLTPPLYGYDKDEETEKLVINPEEAKVVRLCFFLYLNGFNFKSIAETLTALGIKTYTGKDTWSSSTIRQMLSNERHCGDILARKTFTQSYLDHKVRKNNGERQKYFGEDDHEAIVSRQIYRAVNKKMQVDKSARNNSPMPSLSVIDEGILKGYVPVNSRWEGITEDEFLEATNTVIEKTDVSPAESDSFTIDDYEVVSANFFYSVDQMKLTINHGAISFNVACMKKFEDVEYVEILLNSVNQCIAIRPCSKDNPNAIKWGRLKGSRWYSATRSCRGLINPILSLMNWDALNKYRLTGQFFSQGDNKLLLFSLRDPEVIPFDIPSDSKEENADVEQQAEDEEIAAGRSEQEEATAEDENISFGRPAKFGRGLLLERQPYYGDWEVLRPATFYKYCADITPEEMDQVKKEAMELLTELKEA